MSWVEIKSLMLEGLSHPGDPQAVHFCVPLCRALRKPFIETRGTKRSVPHVGSVDVEADVERLGVAC